ncbi:hypothetical protein FACS1894179_04850 [Bacteroidia bacterium]|nr:hypothetical protein FACS1894179_04850 [Bacteroidia bacterium]
MGCKLIQNIKHSCEYNAGGITEIYLLDIDDFVAYQFEGDALYDGCMVDTIKTQNVDYLRMDTVIESNFTETQDSGIFKQTLSTFVGTPEASKTSNLLLSAGRKYLVVFKTSQGMFYSFGSDGGATIAFSQQTGQQGEASGYSIAITKNSIYPLFEVNARKFNKILVLGTHPGVMVPTEDNKKAILI